MTRGWSAWRRNVGWAALLLSAGVATARATAPTLPKPERYATDRTGRLDSARIARLNETLASFERETSTQVVVYVDARLPGGTVLEDLAARTFREWGIGQRGRDNGVLLLVFLDDRKIRLEVGYGLEGVLPDATAWRITSERMVPLFKRGDFIGGVEGGAQAVLAVVRGEGLVGTGQTVAESRRYAAAPTWLATLPTLLGIVAGWLGWRGRSGRLGRGFNIGLAAAGAIALPLGFVARSPGFLISGFGLLVLSGLVLAIRHSRGGGGGAAGYSAPGDSSTSWSSSDSSSGSDSSSSDFSGGGGDSGGGGSSDSW